MPGESALPSKTLQQCLVGYPCKILVVTAVHFQGPLHSATLGDGNMYIIHTAVLHKVPENVVAVKISHMWGDVSWCVSIY